MKIIFAVIAVIAFVSSTFAQSSICSLPHSQIGNCRALIPSWSYNSNTKDCVKFTYGGCGGNKNRFGSQGECARQCKKNSGRNIPKNKRTIA